MGCGSQALLVKWGRERRYEFYGVDPLVNKGEEPYLQRKAIRTCGNMPFPRDYFGLVVAHVNNGLTDADSNIRPYLVLTGSSVGNALAAKDLGCDGNYDGSLSDVDRRERKKSEGRAEQIMLEAMRLSRLFVYYPSLGRFEERIAKRYGWSIRREPVDKWQRTIIRRDD